MDEHGHGFIGSASDADQSP